MELRKELLGAIIGLAKTCGNNPKTENTDRILLEGLVAVHTESFGEEMLEKKLHMVRQEKDRIAPNCRNCASPCENTSEYDLELLLQKEEGCREKKLRMLQDIVEAAVAFYQVMLQGFDVSEHMEIFFKVLSVVTYDMEPVALEAILGEIGDEKLRISNYRV